MTIDPKETIAGQPILKIRDFLLRWTDRIDEELIGDVLEISSAEAGTVLKALIKRGYVERREDDRGYSRTLAGGQLANAHATKRITRQTANRLLSEVVARIDEANRREEFIYHIPRAAVFGSFLGDGETLGDVDIALDLRSKTDDPIERDRALRRRVRECGRSFGSIGEELMFPYEEVLRFIKNRNGAISLRDWDQLERVAGIYAEIYPECENVKVLAAIAEGAKAKKPLRKYRPSPARLTISVTLEVEVGDPKATFAALANEQAQRHDGEVPEDLKYYDIAEAISELAFDRLEEAMSALEGIKAYGGSSWARRIPKSELQRREHRVLEEESGVGSDRIDDPG